jgi:predicted transglutaminase-like cysteine proteinase
MGLFSLLFPNQPKKEPVLPPMPTPPPKPNLEELYNNKYPKKNLNYKRTESDGEYKVDLRNFIQWKDATLPVIHGATDDEKALNALTWVRVNIQYTPDKTEYNATEYWAYAYQTLKHRKGDCEDGAILLNNILLKNGVPYWKLRLTAGNVLVGDKKVGHAYLTYFCEDTAKWVVLDWCYWPVLTPIKDRKDYKDEEKYLDVWFSWNRDYCYSAGLNNKARELLK